MQMRTLGRGLVVSSVGLGCMGMSGPRGFKDDDESVATIRRALDLGVTFLDTSDSYGDGLNEELIATAIEGRRDEVVLATKFGNSHLPNGHFAPVNGRPEYVKAACDASLRRLRTDVIDLYYQHRVDPATPVEATFGALAELVAAGKVRHVGISEAAPATVRRAHAVIPLTASENEYSLFTRGLEDELLPTLRELGIGLVPYSPLGRGLITGTIRSIDQLSDDDGRRKHPRFQGENFEHNLSYIARLDAIAEKKGVTTSQLALAWVLAQGDDIVPIPGTKQRKYLEQNVAATDVRLDEHDLQMITDAVPRDAVQGAQYPAAQLSMINL